MNRNYLIQISACFLLSAMGVACADDVLDVQVLYSRKTSASAPRSLEIIHEDDRLTAVLAALGKISVGGPNPEDGGTWQPTVDFDRYVVAFATVPFGAAQDDVEVRRATQSNDKVSLEIAVHQNSCYGDAIVTSFYALVRLPRVNKAYVLVVSNSSPKCN